MKFLSLITILLSLSLVSCSNFDSKQGNDAATGSLIGAGVGAFGGPGGAAVGAALGGGVGYGIGTIR